MATNKTKYLQARIERIFELADDCDDDEIKSELACFAAVLSSGLVESACRHSLLSYTSKRANRQILSYVEANLYFFQNAKTSKIEELLRSFDPDFADRMRSSLTEEELAAIDSVVNNKNNLAHGENPGLSLEVMKGYYGYIKTALEKLASICK